MVRGNMGDRRQALTAEPLIRIVVVQVGDPARVRPVAAEFADVVAERGGAYHRDVDRESGSLGLAAHVQGQVVDADGMGGRVKGHDLSADPHQLHEIRLPHRLPAGREFRGTRLSASSASVSAGMSVRGS